MSSEACRPSHEPRRGQWRKGYGNFGQEWGVLRAWALVALLPGLVFPLPLRAQNATVGELMQIACPDAYAAETSANRAFKLAQSDFADIVKNAATLYYVCFQRLSDPYNRDWANYRYLNMLEFSAACNDTGLQTITDSLDGATQLAETTTFADVE